MQNGWVPLLAFPLVTACGAAAQVIEWAKPSDGMWDVRSNWLPKDVPDDPFEFVRIDQVQPVTITVRDRYSIGGLDVTSSNTTIYIRGGRSVAVQDGAAVNNGRIVVSSDHGAGQAIFAIWGDSQLIGTGAVVLAGVDDEHEAIFAAAGGIPLLHGRDHTILGSGWISAQLRNEGTIIADAPSRPLNVLGLYENTGLIGAAKGATLCLTASACFQSGAGRIAATGGCVQLFIADIIGGSIESSDGGYIELRHSTLRDIVLAAEVRVPSDTEVSAFGSLFVNNGRIVLNSDGGPRPTTLRFADPDRIDGTGEIVLRPGLNHEPVVLISHDGEGRMTNGPGHTIRGTGRLKGNWNNLGRLAPGLPTGVLAVKGFCLLEPSSSVEVEIGGIGPDRFDQLLSDEGIFLGGSLAITLQHGFWPRTNDRFSIVRSPVIVGTFDEVSLPELPPGLRLDVLYSSAEVALIATCLADADGDGLLTVFDFLWFTNLFEAGDDLADCDGDGALTVFDFLCFSDLFHAGCP